MRRALSRLRWQLTLSHLVAIAFTLVSMIAAIILISMWWVGVRNSPSREAAQDARTIARAVGGLVRSGGESAELNGVLRALADGRLQVVAPFGPPPARRREETGPSLEDIAYIVVVGLDGRLLGSSDPLGATFAPPERDEWRPLIAESLAGKRDDVDVTRTGGGPAALGAFPILDIDGRPVASVVVAKSALSKPDDVLSLWRALAIFGAATVAVLAGAFVFALASSSFVAYLLSRRLVARLERLGRAAESLAAGDLTCRVEEGPADEVGQLARRFNHMAADFERTLHELEAERDRVAGLLKARRQLIAGVSHELRTPVATVRGYLESALRRGTAALSDLETMERELRRLEQQIEDLFTLSRAEVGRLELRLGPTDVGAVVRRLVDTTAPLAWGQRRVQVLAEVAPDLPLARADAVRLEQVVSNLLGNAVRYTAPGGLVAAAVCAEPEAVRLEVRDTGEGIAPDDLPRVFERFYRGPSADAERRDGAGLGLALVKELAEAMGGSVEASSAPGEGSCFTVRLPRG
jgi:signal transduction histidine kinase